MGNTFHINLRELIGVTKELSCSFEANEHSYGEEYRVWTRGGRSYTVNTCDYDE